MYCVQYTSLKLMLRFGNLSVAGQGFCISGSPKRSYRRSVSDTTDFRYIQSWCSSRKPSLHHQKAVFRRSLPVSRPTPYYDHMCILLGIHINIKTLSSGYTYLSKYTVLCMASNLTHYTPKICKLQLNGKSIQFKQWILNSVSPSFQSSHRSMSISTETAPMPPLSSNKQVRRYCMEFSLAHARLLEVKHSRDL